MAQTLEQLQQYRDDMDTPMEELGAVLSDLGWTEEHKSDHEIVAVASKKLKTLHRMILSTGMSKELLKAAMAE